MFNLKKIIKNKSIRLSTVLLSLLCVSAIGGVLFSCSFLEDDDFFGQIENEVAVANADKMNVYLRYASIKFGKTTPADATYMQIKNNVAFTVNCVTNSEYAFYRWKAFSVKDFDISKQHMSLVYTNDDDWLANYGAKELDSTVVRFENPAAESTLVYVTQTRDDIWIIPVVAVRPTIAGTFPDTSQNPVRNTKLRVQFSKPMDEASFVGNYIISQATRAADFSLNETDITDQFQMVINENKNLVTFSFREDATMSMFNPGVVARLYFTDEIADSTGYTMSESTTLSWNIGSAVDTLPPLITEMTGGIDSDCSKFASTPTRLAATADANLDENALYTEELVSHRIRDKLNIYVYAQDITRADGERLESDVLMLGFRAKSITDLSGKALDGTAEGNFIADRIETYAAEENYSQITGSFRQITGKKAGCLYTYDLSSLPDGLIQVEVYAYDSTGNDGLTGYDPTVDGEDGIGNGPRSLFVIKDNAAPNIQTEVEKVKSSSVAAPFGWYNKVSVDSIEIYDEPSNPVADYGHTKLGATHKGLKWVFHLGTELDWTVPKDDSSWLSLDKHYKVGAASVAQDGSVSISMRLMDDLGNMSEAVAISSVLYDNTPVVTGDISFVDSSGNMALNASSSTVVPDSSILRIPFTEELCGVKVIGINVKNSSGEAVSQPLASASVSYSAGGDASQATPVAIETDKASLQAVFDSEGYAANPVFNDVIDNLNVLGSSYKTGILYIKNFALGSDDGIYTVTATLYDSALNRAESKSITIAHDTTAPSVNRVIVQNVVPRTVYGESASTYWLPKTAYDASGEPSLASIAVTAKENGSGVNVLTLGGNAHLTESSTISVGGTPIGSDKCSIDVASNKITFSDSYSPVMYSASGSISFVITNIRFDASNTEGGNAVSVTLRDFVGNVGSNANSGDNSKFDLYIDSTSPDTIFAIFTDKSAPAIGSVSVADGKQDSASDEVLYSSSRLASDYTDQKKVELALTLSPESSSYGSGVKTIQLTNGVFTSDTAISVNGTVLASSEYTLSGATVTFKKVFVAADILKFTNVELQSADGSQQIAAVAKDLMEWASGEVSSNAIILDTVAPFFGDLDWYVKEGVWGVTKSAVVDNLELIVPFTEVIGGVRCIRVTSKLGDAVEPSSEILASGFAIAYSASDEINESVITGTANLVLGTDYDIVGENVIMLKNPQNYKSGLFILKNLKVSDNFADGKSYSFAVHLTDAALNGTDTDSTIALTSDSTAPDLQRIYINRLIGRTLPITTTAPGASSIDSYWVTRDGFTAIGTAPNRLDVEITIDEAASGVEKITLGGDILLTADSAVYKGATLLSKGTDYEVNESNTEIKFKNKSYPLLKGSESFVVRITNTTLTKEGENSVLITLADFALNSDATSSSSDIAPTETGSEIAAKVYVDYTVPELCSAKVSDRGGASEIASRPDVAAEQEALDGFTNENIVNIVLKTKNSALDSTRRSGVKKLVLGGGAEYTTESKFYYKDIDETDDAALVNADATSDGTGYHQITRVSASGDTAEFMDSYSCEKVCVFIITNIALPGTDGTKEVSAYPVDLAGWSNIDTAVTSTIVLDTTRPAWESNPVVMGSIGEAANDAAYVYPKAMDAAGVTGTTGTYFYKRPSEQNNLFLNVKATDTNIYSLHYVGDSGTTDSSAVVLAAKSSGRNFVEAFSDVPFDVADSHSYTIVLKDRAGNLSAETRTIHVVKDSEAEIVNDDASGSSLQNNMTYADSRSDYHIFKTSAAQPLDSAALGYTAENGVDTFGGSGESGYAVYYNCGTLGENPVTITVDITNHKEKNITLNSGVAYYAINGSSTAPTESLSEAATAPTTALQNWNKWIPFTSGASSLTLWPKNDGTSPLSMKLWFKDNVGNVQSIDIKNNASQNEPDVWICDNDIPQNANGTTNGFVPENNQLSSESTGFDFRKIMPDHAWFDGTALKFMNTSALTADDAGKTANTIYYTSTPKLTLVINNEPTTSVSSTAKGTIIGNGTTSGELEWAVKVFLYPSASAEAPSRETVKGWIASNPIRAVTGVPSDSAITLSDIPYPPECNAATPYIYVVAEDRVGNINISKLNVKVEAPSYNSTSNSTYWYGKFIYSADTEAPQIWLGGTGVHGDGTKFDVNADTFSNAADIARLVPYNAGIRAFVDTTAGKTWISSKDDYSVAASALNGYNTYHSYSGADKRLFFYVDVDTEIPYAYYYSHSDVINDVWSLSSSKVVDTPYSSNSSSWLILDTTTNSYIVDGKVPIPTVIGNNDYMAKTSDPTAPTYLHVADKLGRVKSVRLGNTKYQHDTTAPTVSFTGLAANDKKGLYRIDATSATSLKITISKDAADTVTSGGSVKVYIPTLHAPGTTGSYVSDSDSGLYGYSWLDHLEETATEICRDVEDNDKGFYPTKDDNNSNGYYLIFDKPELLKLSSAKKAYVFDKVGNKTEISINSSVDNETPELTMNFSAQTGYGYGKIYDASTTETADDKKLLNCSSDRSLTTAVFKGKNFAEAGGTEDNPYIIYSNASDVEPASTGTGYILGTFVAKDKDSSDDELYEGGILTEIIVNRYIVVGSNPEEHKVPSIAALTSVNVPIPTKDTSSQSYTVTMPIYLDGDGDAASHGVSTGYKGKLYKITIKDSGGNETVVWLKVLRDRTAPKFKYDDTNCVDSTNHAVVQGGVGYYSGKVFYQSKSTSGYINPAYIKLPKASIYSDGTAAIGAAYDEDCGVLEKDDTGNYKDSLKRVIDTSPYYTFPVSSDEDGYVKYNLEGNGSSAYSFCLYAVDILGNEATYKLSVENNEISISDLVYCIDNIKPTVSSFDMTTTSSYGKYASDTIHFNYDANSGKYNGYEEISGKFQGFKIKVTTSDTNKTTETSVAKYCFISTSSGITTVPTDWAGYTKKDATSTPNEFTFTIVPKDYYGLDAPDSDPRYIYFYAVDYAGNLSSAKKLTIKINDERPSISGTDTSVTNYVPSEDGNVYYFNKNTTVSTKIMPVDSTDPIRWYGVYDNWDNAVNGYSIAATEVDEGASSTYTGGSITFSFAAYGNTTDDKKHAENTGAISQFTGSGLLFIETWSRGNVPANAYYLPSGTASTWTYDPSVDPPSNVGVPEPASGASKVAWYKPADGTNPDTVYYKNTLTTVDVKLDFPADVAGIKGYKISILSTSASAPSSTEIAGLTVNEFTGTNAIAPSSGSGVVTRTISVTANASDDNDDKKVYVYAVDGLGNVSAPYSFTISKLSNAPDVTGISIDRANISVAGSGAEFVVNDQHKIYVNGSATSVTIKPVIEDDITETAGFALSEDGLNFTDIASSVTDADNKTFTITFGAELPSGDNGSKEYKVYAKNGIGLYSAAGYSLTIVRDVTGPTVSKITLVGSANLITESDINNLYYNNVDIQISSVTAADPAVSSGVAGVGNGRSPTDSTERYSLVINAETGYEPTDDNREFITSNDYIAGAAMFTLRLLNDGSSSYSKSTNGICIAAFDKLGNIKLTPLSAVEITVGTDVDKTISNFIYDNFAPTAPTMVAFSHATATVYNGWYVTDSPDADANINFYYNYNITSINAAPVSANSDSGFRGYKIGENGEVKNSFTELSLSPGIIAIYAEDKAGNVSSAYKVRLINDNTVDAPTLTGVNEASASIAKRPDSTNNNVSYKENEDSVKLDVLFPANDISGLKGYKIKIGSGDISTSVTPVDVSTSNLIEVAIDSTLKAANSFDVKIYSVDNTGNSNTDAQALTVTFNKVSNANDVTGIGDSIVVNDGATENDFIKGTPTTNSLKFYINELVTEITVTPTVVEDVAGLKGFSNATDGTGIQEGSDFKIDVSAVTEASEGTYTIYAVNNWDLYSASPYTITVIRDKTGPVVSSITLAAPESYKPNYDTTEKKLYYNRNDVYISELTAVDANADVGEVSPAIYAVIYSDGTPSGTPEKALGEELKIGELNCGSNNVFIAAKDKLGNVNYTPVNKIAVKLDADTTIAAVDVDGAASFTFVFDNEKPGVPTNIAAPSDKIGNGMFKSTDKDAAHHMYTMYYNTTLLGNTDGTINLEVTFPSDTSGIIGYELIYVPSTGGSQTAPVRTLFATPIAAGATDTALVRTIPVAAEGNMLVKINAVDGAGNVNEDNEATDADGVVEGHVIWLTSDTEAATFTQVTGDYADSSIFSGYDNSKWTPGTTNYYTDGFKIKLTLAGIKSPVEEYAFVVGSSEAPTTWTTITTELSEGVLKVALPDITSFHTDCYIWIRDKVGNVTTLTESGSNVAIGNPNALGNRWWLKYNPDWDGTGLTCCIDSTDSKILYIKGFSNFYPINSISIEEDGTNLLTNNIDDIKFYVSSAAPNVDSTKNPYSVGTSLYDLGKDYIVDAGVVMIKAKSELTGLKIKSITIKNSQDTTGKKTEFTTTDISTGDPFVASSPSLFGGFFSRVSSGVSSVFGGGRSMSHEELMAQKEAKAAKARARAAEKAAKKAAKAAKKSSAKSDSVAESKAWGGLSSGFESSSAELDAAVSQLKSSELANTSAPGSQKKDVAKKVRVVSKNSSAIEVAALASEAASEPEISSINIEETEQGGSKLLLVIGGILASLGAAGGIFLKKSRKS